MSQGNCFIHEFFNHYTSCILSFSKLPLKVTVPTYILYLVPAATLLLDGRLDQVSL